MALTQISTAGVKDDAVTAGKIPADAVGSSEIAANAVGSSELADNAVDTAAIADDAVTDAKLANSINTAIAANTAKVQTTINNNADNRVITGSGTANNLEAEPNLTFNNSNSNLTVGSGGVIQSTSSAGNLAIGGGNTNPGGQILFKGGNSDGNIVFKAQTGTSTPAERMSIASDGRITQKTGSLIIDQSNNGYGGLRVHDNTGGEYSVDYILGRNSGASAHVFKYNGRTQNQSPWSDNGLGTEMGRWSARGISFNGDTAAANALNDYEEGTYTPVITYASSDSGNKAYANQYGVYTKIGRKVTCLFIVQLTNKGTGSGNLEISLPFAVPGLLTGTSLEASGMFAYYYGLSSSVSSINMTAIESTSRVRLDSTKGQYSTQTSPLAYSEIGNDLSLRGTITYFVA